MKTRFVELTRLTLITALALVAACARSTSPGDADGESFRGSAERRLADGLVVRVSVEPSAAMFDTDITIRSVIVNTSSVAQEVQSRECGFDYAGTLRLSGPPHVLKCMAYSGRRRIAPGDSVAGADLMRVKSPPGTYELRVRHLLTPETWVPVRVTVR